jgi:hypothetical protein
VRIPALEDGTIDTIECVVHYLKRRGSSLLSREAHTVAQIAADAMRRQNPELYAERVREKYIGGAGRGNAGRRQREHDGCCDGHERISRPPVSDAQSTEPLLRDDTHQPLGKRDGDFSEGCPLPRHDKVSRFGRRFSASWIAGAQRMTVWQTIWGAGFGCSRGWAFARKPSRLCTLPTFPKHFNGHDLRKLPVFERKALKKIIAETDIQYSKSFEVDGGEMFKHACSTGLEGVVSKVRDSKYTSGRTNDWAKNACAQRETLTIAGSRSTAANGTACIWPDAEAAIRFTLARSIMASTRTTPKNHSRASIR